MRWMTGLAALLIAAGGAASLWWWADRPVPVAAEWHGPLSSVSFTPYRRGLSPLTETYATPAQIEEDIVSLVGKTEGLRTYSSREGMEVVPDLAAKYGMTVTFGAWLGGDPAINDAEIAALISAANAHPDTIRRVLVGNEVMLRRDLTPAQLIAAIRKVKAAIKQPVSTADVWSFYLKHPEVGREVDYITIHILPFWEDEPVPIEKVDSSVVAIVERIQAAFPGKPILIGETGWPSLGRDRGPARVSTVNEARYIRQIANLAALHGFDVNFVEAFDQPWKSALENTVGAYWGVLDEYRQAKFPMVGPVTELADWPARARCALGIGLLLALAFGGRLRRFPEQLILCLAAQLLSWLLITTAFHVIAVTFRPWQYLWLGLRIGLPLLLVPAILARCRDWLLDPGLSLQAASPRAAGDDWGGQIAMLSSACYAVGWSGLLLADGRYRDIPDADFLVPVGGLTMMLALRLALTLRQRGNVAAALGFDGLFPGRRRLVTPLVGWLLPLAALAALASEGLAVIGEDFVRDHPTLGQQFPRICGATLSNPEMNLWAAMLLVLAVPFLMSGRARDPLKADTEQQRHHHQPADKPPPETRRPKTEKEG